MIKKIKQAWEIINYPTGIDKEFDEACESSFHRFLDGFIRLSYVLLFLFGCMSAYFFITHEILK